MHLSNCTLVKYKCLMNLHIALFARDYDVLRKKNIHFILFAKRNQIAKPYLFSLIYFVTRKWNNCWFVCPQKLLPSPEQIYFYVTWFRCSWNDISAQKKIYKLFEFNLYGMIILYGKWPFKTVTRIHCLCLRIKKLIIIIIYNLFINLEIFLFRFLFILFYFI